jgi:hypothetical protein
MGPLRESTPRISKRFDALVSRVWPGLFAFHIIVTGKIPADR